MLPEPLLFKVSVLAPVLICRAFAAEITGAAPVNWTALSASWVTLTPESITTLPVEGEPMFKVWSLVVPKTPAPLRYAALFPLLAEMDATGVPPALLRKANLADSDDVPPIKTSTVLLKGAMVPTLPDCQKLAPMENPQLSEFSIQS